MNVDVECGGHVWIGGYWPNSPESHQNSLWCALLVGNVTVLFSEGGILGDAVFTCNCPPKWWAGHSRCVWRVCKGVNTAKAIARFLCHHALRHMHMYRTSSATHLATAVAVAIDTNSNTALQEVGLIRSPFYAYLMIMVYFHRECQSISRITNANKWWR